MFFVVFAADKPNSLHLRMETKAAHVLHLDKGGVGVQVLQTGPWIGPGGQEAGSILVLQAEQQSDVEAFMDADPYVRAGLFASIEVRPWKWRRGNPYLTTASNSSPLATELPPPVHNRGNAYS